MSFAIKNALGQYVTLPLSKSVSGGVIIWCNGIMAMGEPPREEYRCHLAIAFDDDTDLGAIFAVGGGNAIDVTKLARIYDGTQTEPDPLLEKACGPGSPVYRGIKYAVFEDFDLGPHVGRVPTFFAGTPE